MLCLVLASTSFAPVAYRPAPAVARASVPLMADDAELSMLQTMSESFWKQKRARMKAELAAQLLELDEFEAREKALQEMAISSPSAAIGAGAGAAELQAALEAERAKSAAHDLWKEV